VGRRLIMALGAVAWRSRRGCWDGDKQCYIVEHAYAFLCVASSNGSCLAASVSQIGSLRNLSIFKARCVGRPFCSSLHGLIAVFWS